MATAWRSLEDEWNLARGPPIPGQQPHGIFTIFYFQKLRFAQLR